MNCDKCGRAIVLEGKKKENYFVENKLKRGEKVEATVCTGCFYAAWGEAEVKKWEKCGLD